MKYGKIFPRTFLFYSSLVYLIMLIGLAVTAPFIVPCDPVEQNLSLRFTPPGKEFPLGSDDFGRDVLSRIIYGSRPTLLVGFISVLAALVLGVLTGLTAGLANSWLDNLLMLMMDSILSFPTVLLAITVVSFLGYGSVQVMLTLGTIYSPIFARLVRAETLVIKTEIFVEASRSLGSGTFKIVLRHIIPNLLGKLVVQCSITFAMAVVVEAALSYLGLGTQPPNPSWGLMLKDARNYLMQAPWMAVYPGLILALTVLFSNLLGDILAEQINPKVE
ncbi:MAG: ABC transporter permease [Treponema sp.]|jgi:ABC-type dipeptide/oligopeptide/nickel transport system permease subunit|nr:ABC transporter permease [Treponema sp.]